MKRKTMKKKTYLFDSMLVTALFAVVLTMGACAENDLENRNSEGDKGAAVSFEVKDVQEAVLADSMPGSRAGDAATFNHQLNELGLTQADLEMQVLEAQAPEGMEACLVESTLPGINPVLPDPQTRATVTKTLTADFSTLGYRATSQTAVSSTPDWFYNARTKSNGELYNTLYWSWSGNHFGRFYGVYPEVKDTYSKIKLSPATHVGNPYVEFEVEPNVVDQKDLMTACSGVVEYQSQGVAPNTSLAFRHALTAVHFSVGQNLWAGQITKIEISGAINKGTYTLSSDPTQSGTWTLGSTTGTFTLDGININTAASPGSVITDDNGSYTFFMIPQQVTGKNIYVDIHFQDGKIIHVPLKGKWLPGTTKTYTLSNQQSNWQYHFEVIGRDNTVDYNVTNAGTYHVYSYRQVGSTILPVKWKVVSYQESEDDGFTWGAETTEKPRWLTNLSLTEGQGGRYGQSGSATVTKENLIDKLKIYNDAMKAVQEKGSPERPYNLANQIDGDVGTQNTANCYLISAPGYYRIPLVYGNAIQNYVVNSSSYTSSKPVTMRKTSMISSVDVILHKFKDHNDQDIRSPYIQDQCSRDPATQANLVWADRNGLVENVSLTSIMNSYSLTFVDFHVPADKICNGNAVVAVQNAAGTILWSWHLWFAHSDALNVTPCTNYQGKVYKFPKEPLGFARYRWEETTYDKPRVVKVKIEQGSGNNPKRIGYITITQNPGKILWRSATYYQWGRKDPLLPYYFDGIQKGPFTFNYERNRFSFGFPIGYSIQKPYSALTVDKRYVTHYLTNVSNDWCTLPYYNLWSAENNVSGGNDNPVVKTIYDPCPVGFHVPASNAFTGFSTTGENFKVGDGAIFNAKGKWDYGWHFYNKITNPDATIYFPTLSTRANNYEVKGCADYNVYWSCIPCEEEYGHVDSKTHAFYYTKEKIFVMSHGNRESEYNIFPVADE